MASKYFPESDSAGFSTASSMIKRSSTDSKERKRRGRHMGKNMRRVTLRRESEGTGFSTSEERDERPAALMDKKALRRMKT